MYYIDYLLYMLPALLLGIIAQIMVKSSFSRFSKRACRKGLTGAEAAYEVMSHYGASGVAVSRVAGHLTDHYDPRSNVINLSDSVYANTSIAAIGVAAHEAGHAVQYFEEYSPIKIRMKILPVCSFGSRIGPILIIVSFFLSYLTESVGADYLYFAGLALFSLAAVFQIVTLPVEFNASKRALAALSESGTLEDDELKGARSVLRAAALTYVAALVTSIMQILYYASRFRGRDR